MASPYKILCIVLAAAFLAACANDGQGIRKQDVGMIGGAVGGAIAGNAIGGRDPTARVLGIIAGGVIGGAVGGYLGSLWDNYDRQQAGAALENNPDQQSSSWVNPNNNAQGQFTPTRTFSQNNLPCRDFTTSITVDGRPETGRGTACRQPDGTWSINSSTQQ